MKPLLDACDPGPALPFDFLGSREVFETDEIEWTGGRISARWSSAYRKPLRILSNGFSRQTLSELFRRGLWRTGREMAREIEGEIQALFGFRPTLPPVPLEIVDGRLPAWRRREGHFLAMRCNGCGEVVPAYWLEYAGDRAHARRLERRHPAIPFLWPRAAVYFEGREFVGCFCHRLEMAPEARRETA